ncbi:MAG: 4Fe-4S binding protein [Spirochaetales bacterium]|nr:4Fe-4S binding protein [Spirochaetales bacterium]
MLPVYTVGEVCKKCYSCVRACPTKAIEVHEGQADIIADLCISCGYCVEMCSQGAKKIRSSVDQVRHLLSSSSPEPCYAMLAPSFPAAFLNTRPEQLIGAVAACGFDGVYEVAFGADLVSWVYNRAFEGIREAGDGGFIISSPCPAVVSYVEKFHPELVTYLAGIMSPMEAMATVIKEKINPRGHIVFIGPCVAKKEEKERLGLVEEVLTFRELEELFIQLDVDPSRAEMRDFDPPRANLGRIYPVTGGLLKAANIENDLVKSPVAVVEGSERAVEILHVLDNRLRNNLYIENRFFDILFCEGCIAGPAMPNDLSFYERKKYIVEFMRKRELIEDLDEWAERNKEYLDLDFYKCYFPRHIVAEKVPEEEIKRILAMTDKYTPEDELNCRACGYNSCRDKAIAVYKGIAEVEMCLPYLISKLEKTIDNLKDNQSRLIQAEKLASMGQMAAGIAHEINNPLGVILMYSHLLRDELTEADEQAEDVDRIILEAERTKKIVNGILNFAREEKVDRVPTDLNVLLKDVVKIFREKEGEKYRFHLILDETLPIQMIDPGQMKQVFDNIIRNAVEAMSEGGEVTVTSRNDDKDLSVIIADTGPGISEENMRKLFSAFFTTKPVGKGTGLGLAVSYGIVKMHGGSIHAGNNKDKGAYFEIRLNKNSKEASIA